MQAFVVNDVRLLYKQIRYDDIYLLYPWGNSFSAVDIHSKCNVRTSQQS